MSIRVQRINARLAVFVFIALIVISVRGDHAWLAIASTVGMFMCFAWLGSTEPDKESES